MKSQKLINVLKVLIAGGLMIWLLESGKLDFAILFSAPLNIFFFLGIPVLFVNMLLQAVRWWGLLRIQSINLSLWQAIQLSWIGQFFSLVLPSAAGGDVVRGYYIAQNSSTTKTASVSTVILDRIMGLYAVFLLGITSLLVLIVQNELTSIVIQMGALIMLLFISTSLLFLTLLVRSTRSLILGLMPRRFYAPIEATIDTYRAHSRELFACFSLSLLASLILMGAFLLASQIVNSPLGWQEVFLVCPLVILANSLPISPGGVGVAETTALVLFAQFGIETGAVIMLIVRLWTLILRLPGGLIFIYHKRSSTFAQPLKEAKTG